MKGMRESDPVSSGGVAAGDSFDTWRFERSPDKKEE
jgi:hypothetical protein